MRMESLFREMILWDLRKRKALLPVKSLAASVSPATASGQTGTAEKKPAGVTAIINCYGYCVCFFEKNQFTYILFLQRQLINYRRDHQNYIDAASWPSSLENVNSLPCICFITLKESCLLKDNHISMQVIWVACTASETHVRSLSMH